MIRGDGWSFTHIPKTGGSSITAAIVHMQTGEWPVEEKGWHGRHHDQHAMHGGYRHYDGVRGFAFVRDPWELYLSLWWSARSKDSWLTVRNQPELIESFGAMMEFIMADPSARDTFFKPFQRHLTCPKTGERVELVGRYEHLVEDLGRICGTLGLDLDLPYYNYRPANRPTVQEVYSKTLAALVHENHAADCEEFGYAAPNL